MTHASPTLKFSEEDLVLLARTADALSAWLGKPVLAETGYTEDGVPWALFGVALAADEPDTLEDGSPITRLQLGGRGARWLGNVGGLNPGPDDEYDCRYLWAIQMTDDEQARYVKLDESGDTAAWSGLLADLLPFGLAQDPEAAALDDEDEDEDDDTPGHAPGHA